MKKIKVKDERYVHARFLSRSIWSNWQIIQISEQSTHVLAVDL